MLLTRGHFRFHLLQSKFSPNRSIVNAPHNIKSILEKTRNFRAIKIINSLGRKKEFDGIGTILKSFETIRPIVSDSLKILKKKTILMGNLPEKRPANSRTTMFDNSYLYIVDTLIHLRSPCVWNTLSLITRDEVRNDFAKAVGIRRLFEAAARCFACENDNIDIFWDKDFINNENLYNIQQMKFHNKEDIFAYHISQWMLSMNEHELITAISFIFDYTKENEQFNKFKIIEKIMYYIYNYYLHSLKQQQVSSPESNKVTDEYSRKMVSIIDGDPTPSDVIVKEEPPQTQSSSQPSPSFSHVSTHPLIFSQNMSTVLYLVLSNLLSSSLHRFGYSMLPEFFQALGDSGTKYTSMYIYAISYRCCMILRYTYHDGHVFI